MPESVVRISSKAKELVEEIAKKTGRSVSQIVTEAIYKTYLGTDRVLDNVIDKKVLDVKTETFKTKTDSLYCTICKRQINRGEIVTVMTIFYDDNTQQKIFYCYNCYLSESISDEKLLKLEKRVYELNRIIRLLRNEKNKLLNEITKYEKIVNNIDFLLNLEKKIDELKQKVDESTRDKLDEMFRKINELYEVTGYLIKSMWFRKEKKMRYERYER
ncbi:MAG: hypothetical protein QW607_12480 [Desulfurococcaceae archaeon]